MYIPTTTDSLFPKSNSLRKRMAYAVPYKANSTSNIIN